MTSRQKYLILTAVLGLAVSAFFIARMRRAEEPAPGQSGQTVRAIQMELAFVPARADSLLARWGEGARERLVTVTHYDYGFIPGYVLFLGALCLLAGGAGSRTGVRLAGSVVAAGVLDLAENASMLAWLRDASKTGALLLTGVAASVKFLLLIVAVLYVLVRAGQAVFGRRS